MKNEEVIEKKTSKINKYKFPQIIKRNNKVITIDKYDERYEKKITFTDMVYVFMICAVLGWLVETVYVFLACGKLVSRGMAYGPYCGIYGLAGLILYLFFHNVKPKKENIPFTFIATALTMGGFELVSGLFLKYVFGIEMWNYDTHFLSICHYTTVPIMIGWGVLATFYVFYLQPLLLKVISSLPKNIAKRLAVIILIVYLLDFSLSIFNIYNNPEILWKMVNPYL